MSEPEFPKLWRLTNLEDIAEMVGGGTPSRKNTSYFEGSIPWLTGYDLPEDTVGLIDHGREYITLEAIQESATNRVPAETVLITTRVNVGKVAVAQTELCFSQDVTGIFLNEKLLVDPEYVGFYLMLNRDDLLRRNRGTTITGITRDDLRQIQLPLPPLPEQRRIVEMLRKADELRRLRRDAERETQTLLPALFENMFGDLEENPKGWATTALSQVCTRITDGTHQPPPFIAKGIPFLFVTNIIHGYIDYQTEKFISEDTFNSLMERCPVEIGDILYSTVGSYGIAVSVDEDRPFSFQRHIAHIKPNHEVINTTFLRTMLNSAYVKSQADRRARGIAQKTVNLNEIAQFQIIIPPLELQNAFAKRAEFVIQLKEQQNKAQKSTHDLFLSVLSRAFSGELTERWRERRRDELTLAADERDRLLAERGAARIITISGASQLKEADDTLTATGTVRHPREELLITLSSEQRQIWEAASKADGYLNAEMLSLPPELPLARTRQTLELLAATGLLLPVSLWNPEIGNFVPAYRPLRPADEENNERGDEAYDNDLALLEKR